MTAPLQTELHRHLDVSVRTGTLLELAQARGLEGQSTSLEAFREKLIIRQPMTDLNSVLAQFSLFSKVMDRPEVLERIALECVQDCFTEGTRRVELRFSPTFVTEHSKLPWIEVLEAFERGVALACAGLPGMQAGLLCIASRDFGVDEVRRTVEFYLDHQSRFLGLDLAGNEVAYPCRMFEDAFKLARKRNAQITIHAGEASGPENMWEAIELLGARRIGHGIACVRDPELMVRLRRDSICLEMCPTSNWLTQSVEHMESHPLPQALRAGIPVCINTDDPGIFGVTLPDEFEVCRTRMNLTELEIETCLKHAASSSFLNLT